MEMAIKTDNHLEFKVRFCLQASFHTPDFTHFMTEWFYNEQGWQDAWQQIQHWLPKSNIQDAFLRIYIDPWLEIGSETFSLGALDLSAIQTSAEQEGEYFFFTCTCGVPGCAGFQKGVIVKHFPEYITLFLGAYYEEDDAEHKISWESYRLGIAQAIQDLHDILGTAKDNTRLAKCFYAFEKVKFKDIRI